VNKLRGSDVLKGSAVGKQEKSESPEGDEDAVLECNNSEQTGIVFSSKDAKGSIQKQLAGKKVVMEHQSDGDGQNLEHGKVPRLDQNVVMITLCWASRSVISVELCLCYAIRSGIPSPLATKIYHSQGNHRLRLALGHIYIETVTRDRGCDARKKLVEDSGRVSLEDRSHHAVSMEATKGDIPLVERDAYPSTAVPNPDQILAESSEVYLGDNRGCPPAVGLTNQLRDSNFPRSGLAVDGASMGIMRSRYHPVAYPFPSNSGTALGKIQQPNGSVPVV
ncbi:hypothetical protein Taro_023787, partial [Colocasia esculenta]|nr:hypothetical protein [Colocasia esculenta]